MSDESQKTNYLDANQVVFLPFWARISIISLLGLLAIISAICGVAFLFDAAWRDKVVPLLSIAQTAAGGFAIVLFVLFAEKQLSTSRLLDKTNQFLDIYLPESLAKIELPAIEKDKTINVTVMTRDAGIYGYRKDIYGVNYELSLKDFKMRMWVGINVRRISTIYFVKVESEQDAEKIAETFRFTFGGAEKVGYNTNFEFCTLNNEHFVSMWSTVNAENAILGNPAEQLFWMQDIAMMTQSIARTAIRHQLSLFTTVEPGPL